MSYILKNTNLEIHIDNPLENYNSSRFDWTGKIVHVKFQNDQFSSCERLDCLNDNLFGRGFYNEFGIDTALGFDETDIGGWFHKIGVGLLKKDDAKYVYDKKYEIIPAKFECITDLNSVSIKCSSTIKNGYGYFLEKKIELHENGFTIKYDLQNTGVKEIITDEYNHNFMAIDNELIGTNYVLKFPFQLKPELFDEVINPEKKVDMVKNEVKFNNTIKEDFFFRNLTGSERVTAKWELINLQRKIGINEIGSFFTNKINLWGSNNVISPELFYKISLKPGQSVNWFRNYKVFKVN